MTGTVKEIKNQNFHSMFSYAKLPLFYGILPKDEIDELNIARALPFELGINSEKGLIQQKLNDQVLSVLNEIYQSSATIAPPPGVGDFGKDNAGIVIKALLDAVDGDIRGKDVLEIGCSNGYILNELKKLGANVVGIEPGVQAAIAREEFGLDVQSSYFEEVNISKKFDLIYAINVLEHISDLDIFMEKVFSLLKNQGCFFVGVPDSSIDMLSGNPNMFAHEHWWYFTPDTITNYFQGSGLENVRVSSFTCGAEFYCSGRATSDKYTKMVLREEEINKVKNYLQDYSQKLSKLTKGMQARINNLKNGFIGLYGASNATNFISLLDWSCNLPKVYDGDVVNCGRYLLLDGYEIKVQGPSDLLQEKPKEIWILPTAYQKDIKEFLLEKGIKEQEIFLLNDFQEMRI